MRVIAPTLLSLHRNRGRPPNSNHCVVCMQESANAVLVGCGHLCACMACALDLKVRL